MKRGFIEKAVILHEDMLDCFYQIDAELLMKVLANPEMTALLTSLAKTMK